MKVKLQNQILKAVKATSMHQVKDSAKEKCLWWCYEPKMPASLNAKVQEYKNK